MAAVDVEAGAVQHLRAIMARARRRVLDLVEHTRDVILDEIQGRHHLGDALAGEEEVEKGIAGTQAFLGELYKTVSASAEAGEPLKQAYDKAMTTLQPRYGDWVIFEHCMPFDVSRAYDEAKGIEHPVIWTAERDRAMWAALRA